MFVSRKRAAESHSPAKSSARKRHVDEPAADVIVAAPDAVFFFVDDTRGAMLTFSRGADYERIALPDGAPPRHASASARAASGRFLSPAYTAQRRAFIMLRSQRADAISLRYCAAQNVHRSILPRDVFAISHDEKKSMRRRCARDLQKSRPMAEFFSRVRHAERCSGRGKSFLRCSAQCREDSCARDARDALPSQKAEKRCQKKAAIFSSPQMRPAHYIVHQPACRPARSLPRPPPCRSPVRCP